MKDIKVIGSAAELMTKLLDEHYKEEIKQRKKERKDRIVLISSKKKLKDEDLVRIVGSTDKESIKLHKYLVTGKPFSSMTSAQESYLHIKGVQIIDVNDLGDVL